MKWLYEIIVVWFMVLVSFMIVGIFFIFSKWNVMWFLILMEKKSLLFNNIKRFLNKVRFSNVKCVFLGFFEVIIEICVWSILLKFD